MPRKKKLEPVRFSVTDSTVVTEIDANTNSTSANLPVVFEQSITPLELNPNLGRQDLNEMVERLQEKINEIIKKVN